MRIALAAILACIAALGAPLTRAQSGSQAPLPPKPQTFSEAVLFDIFERANRDLVCLEKNMEPAELVQALRPRLAALSADERDSIHTVSKLVYTTFPCPFSPQRPELRPATREDLIGYWLFPEASLNFKFGPNSSQWQQYPASTPWKCEGISFLASGRYQVMAGLGRNFQCPTPKTMEDLQALPQVQSWTVLPGGNIRITRTDVPEAWEEWEIYQVVTPFTFQPLGKSFGQGDLLAYRRVSQGNRLNIAEQFRHLQRMN